MQLLILETKCSKIFMYTERPEKSLTRTDNNKCLFFMCANDE